jgi:hypothetical protein
MLLTRRTDESDDQACPEAGPLSAATAYRVLKIAHEPFDDWSSGMGPSGSALLPRTRRHVAGKQPRAEFFRQAFDGLPIHQASGLGRTSRDVQAAR